MLKDIKSSFIINNIFSHVGRKIPLNLFVHNKKFQNILNIGKIDYRRLSKKYIVKEGEISRVYDAIKNSLLFEGHYLNGKRNGKGKEFDLLFNKLIFEGNYLNGKKME